MIVWEDSKEPVEHLRDLCYLSRIIDNYGNGWYKGIWWEKQEAVKAIIDEWNNTHSRKICIFDRKTNEILYLSNIELKPEDKGNGSIMNGRKPCKLTDEQRKLVVLMKQSGKSHRFIAKEFGVGETTIRRELKKAKTTLLFGD